MNLKETYNKIAADWHQDHLNDDWWIAGVDKLISFLKPEGTILDIGCAGGLKSKYFADKGFKVVGIDLSDKMIEIAKREEPELTFFTLGLEDVDKLDYFFDGIIMQAVLLHVQKEEVEGNLRKIISKLNIGGYLYITVKESIPGKPEEEVKTENDYGYDYQRFFSYFTKDEIEKHMTNLGMQIIFSDVTACGKTNWIRVIAKK